MMPVSHEDYSRLCEIFRLPHKQIIDGELNKDYNISEHDRRLIYLSLIASKATLRLNNPEGIGRFNRLQDAIDKIGTYDT